MELKSYKYRLYPSKVQQRNIFAQFDGCCELYNMLLQKCKDAYKKEGISLSSKSKLCEIIKQVKADNPELKQVYSQVLQNCADRLSKAYANFFRRAEQKQAGRKIKAGFPRYKKHFHSITYPQFGFKLLRQRRLKVSKIGNVPIVLHRAPKGKLKTLTIKRNGAGQWFAIFSCERPSKKRVHPNADKKVGIDVGLESFATLTTREQIPNPRHLVNAERKLKKLQSRVSRKAKESRNRVKAVQGLARAHQNVFDQMRDFQHKLSRFIVDEFGIIVVEDLNIKGMVKNHKLAKHIHDASWDSFFGMLCYKASSAGGRVLKNPRTKGSTLRCFNCEREVPKSLATRIHAYPFCGVKLHRDYNSALEHLRDTVGLTGIDACGDIPPLQPSFGGWLQAGSLKQELHAILQNFERSLEAHDFSRGRKSRAT
jgi:putative transposase